MPKIVDVEARRLEIIQATWRLIARQGMASTTMRELAKELGLANGALLTYFPNKRSILRAAWKHVFDETFARFEANSGTLHGLAALRGFIVEVLPLDETRLLEARIVIPFWEHATLDDELTLIHERALDGFRAQIRRFLQEAVDVGEVSKDLRVTEVVDALLAMSHGLQALGVLSPAATTPGRQLAMLDAYLAQLKYSS